MRYLAVPTTSARRLLLALAASFAAHAALLSVLELSPSRHATSAAAGLHARLERVMEGAQPAEPVPAPLTEDAMQPDPSPAPADPAPSVPPQPPAPTAHPQARQAVAVPSETAPTGLNVPVPHDLTYYPVAALDAPPRPIGSSDACYPEGAAGEIAYILLINEAGAVDQATLANARPEEAAVALALEGCRALKFAPAMKDGRAVRSRVRFVVGPTAP
jgi:protein TonB